MENRLTEIFNIDSTIKVLALCLLTFGSYLIYKLYRFSSQINRHTTLKISNAFIFISILLFAISFCSLLHILVSGFDSEVIKMSIGIHAISTIFDVTWIVMVRDRINLISGSQKGDSLWLNPFITSISHVIYIQYKINQCWTISAEQR